MQANAPQGIHSSCCASRRALASLLLASALGLSTTRSSAQEPPILNSPYVCANGITYTVLLCKPYRADQWCQWREDQNGNEVVTVNSSWTSMTGRLKGCTNAASKSTAPAPAPSALASATPQYPTSAHQTFNPPYLKDFPTPDQVMSRLKGTSAQDTAYRQLGAFRQLKQFIQDLAGSRWYHNQLTPDESRIFGAYDLAYNNLAKPLDFPLDGYFGRREFIATLFNTFPMSTAEPMWVAADAQMAAKIQATRNQMYPQSAPATQSAPAAQSTSQLPPTNDPTALASRRCFELGGDAMQCMGEGFSKGFQALIGIDSEKLTKPNVTGIVMSGLYKTAGEITFGFSDTGVDIANCGRMVQGNHAYSIQLAGGKLALKIGNEPQPLLMSLGADNRLTGPASQDILGQQIKGYFVHTNLRTGASTRTPDYAPITVHCAIGTLQPGPPVAPDLGFMSDLSGAISATAALMGGGGDSQSNTPEMEKIAPGPRVFGTFISPGGLKVDFTDGGAIIDCKQAHVRAAYSVNYSTGVMKVAVKNPGSPFVLTYGADGKFNGATTATVNGKIMTGLNESTPVFAPTSATCPVDALVPTR